MRHQAIIGFDRKIELDWLDATAAKVVVGAGDREIRDYLWKLLDGEVAGDTSNSARGKTVTVLCHIWSRVPKPILPLRGRALELLPRVEPQERLAVHWSMMLATYPFFADLATRAGSGLALQGDFSLGWMKRRLIERWGERGTLRRAVERIVRSMVRWEVLRDGDVRGVLVFGERLPIAGGTLGELLIESLLLAVEARELPLGRLEAHPALFPFALELSTYELRRSPRFEIHRQTFDTDVVALAI